MPSINLNTGQAHGFVYVKSLRDFGRLESTGRRAMSDIDMSAINAL